MYRYRACLPLLLLLSCGSIWTLEFTTQETDRVVIGYVGLPTCTLYVAISHTNEMEFFYSPHRSGVQNFTVDIGKEGLPFKKNVAAGIKSAVIDGSVVPGTQIKTLELQYGIDLSQTHVDVHLGMVPMQKNTRLITVCNALILKHLPKELEHLRKDIQTFVPPKKLE